MGGKTNPKRDKQIDSARKLAIATSEANIDPWILFGRASSDDIESYSPDMLSAAAIHAATELARWDGKAAHIGIETIAGIEPNGVPVSVLSVIDHNMPFLYDSVMSAVTSTYRDLHLAIHPILVVEPGKPVVAHTTETAQAAGQVVSYIQLHLAPLTPPQAVELIARLKSVLDQVHLTFHDWKPMRALLETATAELAATSNRRKTDRDEALAFLAWLRAENFIFLGMREYIYSGKGADATVERGKGRGLGILSDPDVLVLRQGKDAVTTTPEILAFLDGPDFLIVTKANVKSVVHRRAYMDYVGLKRFDADGNVTGELRMVGLFTAAAYTHSVDEIPLLRAKARDIIQHFGFDPNSHSGRNLQNTLESYPRDDLFQIDTALLAKFCEQINNLTERPRVRVLPRVDRFDRFVSVIVYVPREEYNSIVREKIGAYLKTVYDGHVSAYYPAFPEGGVARVHFIIGRTGGKTPRIATARLEEVIREIAMRWDDQFALLSGVKSPKIAVSQAFQERFTPEETAADLDDILACLKGEPLRIAFHHRRADTAKTLSLKIFHGHQHLPLSRRVPLLENLGFNVISEGTFDIDVTRPGMAVERVVLHDMELEVRSGANFELGRQAAVMEEAFLLAFNGMVDDDTFNRLILAAGLNARQVTVLRAYARYLRQTGVVYAQGHIADTLAKYPDIAARIIGLFQDSFDPGLAEKPRLRKIADYHQQIEAALLAVPNLDEDRTLRRYVNAVDATLRTNYFQRNAEGAPPHMLAFKFDPKRLEGLPQPKPFREIFVYGVEVEGVHLRFGKVARGGIRWSDRGQDYRTEVLGLVKAQQVKNAVIVPVGAKGGFFPKKLPVGGSREEIFHAGQEAYKTYIRTLLSITDNIVDGEVVPPAKTLRLDADDPYFVVAADKGTATFSDTANGLAQEAGFWLDDAFASGGSVGYDHKKMGITARGAWEAAKRHFREMNIDIQTTPFTVAGVGDMSGDVFGNGMLLSEKIRLIAAFDHRDIFIDPDPDMAASLAERQRLFALPRSSWQDYDKSILSAGAMIISRNDKSVKLTPEAMTAIGIGKATATPFEIISAILRAEVDLLWFGGIGTYIKAATETDTDVGDRANDAVRITAEEVRARVTGEGANLGVTQRGRIAYALAGGRCNSDAIDNSAGVNCSDVEVNIKIALASAMQAGRLGRDKRNLLLASMTEDVGRLVLRNNYLQTLAISLTARKGTGNSEELSRLMTVIEASGQLNRKVEMLPDDTAFADRYTSGKPLTRPEIGVLLSYAKIVLFDALVASDLPDDPYFVPLLTDYFPVRMQKTYAADIAGHRLHREIIATLLANEVINRGGPGFIQATGDATGALGADVVKAAVLASDGFGLARLWAETDALDGTIHGETQNSLYADITAIFSQTTRLLLQTGTSGGPMIDAALRLQLALKTLRGAITTTMPAELAADIAGRQALLVAGGIPASLAGEVSMLSALVLAPEIMQIADKTGETLARAAASYFAISQTFRIDRLMAAGGRITTGDHYDSLALTRSLDQIATARRDIIVVALTGYPKDKIPASAWHAADPIRINRIGAELTSLTETGELSLSKIAVAAGLLTDLARGPAR